MKAFTYERADTPAAAAQAVAARPGAKFIAGGTNLLVWMKMEQKSPQCLINIGKIPEL